MHTSIARELLVKSEALGRGWGVVLPSNIKPGTFVQADADNNYINEETTDGKATTHATTVVLYQTGHFGPMPQTSTVYTVMKKLQAMMTSRGQRNTVIQVTFDLTISIKAKEIQWHLPEEFANTVIHMAGFHIILNYLALIGKKYGGSCLEDLLIDSGVYGSATVAAIMRGKSNNRSVGAHKLHLKLETSSRRKCSPMNFSPVSFSIAHIDGSLRRTNKSALLVEIQNNVSDDIQPRLPMSTNGMATAYLIDAMAINHSDGENWWCIHLWRTC
ncbi:hypothetical protein HOLleu_00601 [Holothuria leucospilota]|uniref:Uncharacterized protein n=1 Tax=Holothuria leucospilota TaxID=206669 RepID=A0A9Q1CMG5_HOLLE|nr:hypothetical protein HOLleu_00601 [Holothuria leucospilota]